MLAGDRVGSLAIFFIVFRRCSSLFIVFHRFLYRFVSCFVSCCAVGDQFRMNGSDRSLSLAIVGDTWPSLVTVFYPINRRSFLLVLIDRWRSFPIKYRSQLLFRIICDCSRSFSILGVGV